MSKVEVEKQNSEISVSIEVNWREAVNEEVVHLGRLWSDWTRLRRPGKRNFTVAARAYNPDYLGAKCQTELLNLNNFDLNMNIEGWHEK